MAGVGLLAAVAAVVAWAVLARGGGAGAPRASAVAPTGTDRTPLAAAPSGAAPSGAAPTMMPSFVGTSLSEAMGVLGQHGMTPTVTDTLDESKPDGTVLTQDPQAGGPFRGAVTLTVARAAAMTYLADAKTVGGSTSPDSIESVTLNGKTYAHSLSTSLSCYSDSTTNYDYDLGRHYRHFQATVGLTDQSASEASVQMEVFADGRKVASNSVSLGSPAEVNVDIAGALRLRLTVVQTKHGNNCGEVGQAVWGDARALGVPGEVPLPSPSSPGG